MRSSTHPDKTLVAFDYDGTLSPIVDDPSRAHPEPEIVEGLARLSGHVDLVAVITGRPAQLAVDLAGFAQTPGLEDLVVIGHYGMERWDACSGELGTVDASCRRSGRQGQAARAARRRSALPTPRSRTRGCRSRCTSAMSMTLAAPSTRWCSRFATWRSRLGWSPSRAVRSSSYALQAWTRVGPCASWSAKPRSAQ